LNSIEFRVGGRLQGREPNHGPGIDSMVWAPNFSILISHGVPAPASLRILEPNSRIGHSRIISKSLMIAGEIGCSLGCNDWVQCWVSCRSQLKLPKMNLGCGGSNNRVREPNLAHISFSLRVHWMTAKDASAVCYRVKGRFLFSCLFNELVDLLFKTLLVCLVSIGQGALVRISYWLAGSSKNPKFIWNDLEYYVFNSSSRFSSFSLSSKSYSVLIWVAGFVGADDIAFLARSRCPIVFETTLFLKSINYLMWQIYNNVLYCLILIYHIALLTRHIDSIIFVCLVNPESPDDITITITRLWKVLILYPHVWTPMTNVVLYWQCFVVTLHTGVSFLSISGCKANVSRIISRG
jgi:hypothetical protein